MANVITLEGGDIVVSAILDGGDIYPSGGGGGGLLQTKSVSYTPTESAQTDTVTADPGYDGLEEVDVTIGAISSTYVGSGVTRQAAQIIHPSTSDQSIPSGTYLTGTQGFKAVTTTNLTSGNIKNGVTVKVGDSSDDDRIISVTGTYSGGGANLESKSVSYTPTETAITVLVTPSTGYDGLSQVDVTVDAISSSYVGSAVTRRDSSDLSASGATVTAPAGYYASSASKAIPNAPTPRLADIDIESNGTATATVEVDDGGYIQGQTFSLSLANAVTVQAAQTITPGTTNQTIPAYRWTTGAQTILGDADLVASNIKKDVTIFGVTGTYEGSGGGGQKVLINESVITQSTASVVVDNITYDNLYITTTGLKTAKTSSMGMFLKVTGSICGNKTCTMYTGNVFASVSNHSGWCKIEDLGNGYKQAIRTDAPVLPENAMTIRFLGVGSNSTQSPYQFGDITKIELVPSESAYPFTAGTIRVYGW